MGWPGPLTHRQFQSWLAWREMQWDRPDRADHYRMAIRYEVARSNAKNPNSVKLESMRLRFGGKREDAVAYDNPYEGWDPVSGWADDSQPRPVRKPKDPAVAALQQKHLSLFSGDAPITRAWEMPDGTLVPQDEYSARQLGMPWTGPPDPSLQRVNNS